MRLEELRNLDLQNVGSWPVAARAVAVGVVFVLVFFLGYWFDTRGQIEELERLRQKEVELKRTFERKAAKAANLDAYKRQLEEIRQTFGTMLRQLPSKTEVAGLLVDISQTGLAAGLEFELFKPLDEVPKEFYAELPISIRVRGTFHEFGSFVSGVAALPRIVTLHDFSVRPAGGKAGQPAAGQPPELVMDITAKTYRYLEEGEEEAGK